MRLKLSVPGLVIAGTILIYEVYKKAKEIRESNNEVDENSEDVSKVEE